MSILLSTWLSQVLRPKWRHLAANQSRVQIWNVLYELQWHSVVSTQRTFCDNSFDRSRSVSLLQSNQLLFYHPYLSQKLVSHSVQHLWLSNNRHYPPYYSRCYNHFWLFYVTVSMIKYKYQCCVLNWWYSESVVIMWQLTSSNYCLIALWSN